MELRLQVIGPSFLACVDPLFTFTNLHNTHTDIHLAETIFILKNGLSFMKDKKWPNELKWGCWSVAVVWLFEESMWSFKCVHCPQLVSNPLGCPGIQSLSSCIMAEWEEIRSLSMYNIYFCMYVMYIRVLFACMLAWQKKPSEPCIDGCELLPGGGLELDSCCRREQIGLLITKPSSPQAHVGQCKNHLWIQNH